MKNLYKDLNFFKIQLFKNSYGSIAKKPSSAIDTLGDFTKFDDK